MSFPSDPELSFEEWFQMANRFARADDLLEGLPPERWPGVQTRQLLWCYCQEPRAANAELADSGQPSAALRAELDQVTFLRAEHLNADLHAFLTSHGFDEEGLAGLLEAERILPPEGGRRREERGRDAFTPELRAEVERSEALYFELLPEYAS